MRIRLNRWQQIGVVLSVLAFVGIRKVGLRGISGAVLLARVLYMITISWFANPSRIEKWAA